MVTAFIWARSSTRGAHKGEHPAIIDPELFDAVQAKLAANRVKRVKRKEKATASPLTGKLFDADNIPMRPTFGHGRGKRIYRYYVSETLLPAGQTAYSHNRKGERISASRLERVLGSKLLPLMQNCSDTEAVFKAIARIRVKEMKLRVRLELSALLGEDEIDDDVLDHALQIDPTASIDGHHLVVTIASTAVRRGSALSTPDHITDDVDRRRLLADLVRKSLKLLTRLNASPLHPGEHIGMTAPINEWGRQRVAIGLLAPDIQKMLLQGKAPPHITPELLLSADVPMDWEEQRRMFGMG